jgi:hypothetical protein
MPAPRAVLNGRYAEAAVGGTLIALLFDWEITVETDTVESVAHGELWKKPLALDSGWRFRARGYVVPASTAHYINAYYVSGAGSLYTVTAYSGSVATGTLIWQGTGFPVRGNLSASMALAEQEIEFIGYDVPAVGV